MSWSTSAKRSFVEVIDFIAEKDPQNAHLVRDRILKSVRGLETFSLGVPGPKQGLKKFYIANTSYFVVYKLHDDGGIWIVAFVHAARDWDNIDWDDFA